MLWVMASEKYGAQRVGGGVNVVISRLNEFHEVYSLGLTDYHSECYMNIRVHEQQW